MFDFKNFLMSLFFIGFASLFVIQAVIGAITPVGLFIGFPCLFLLIISTEIKHYILFFLIVCILIPLLLGYDIFVLIILTLILCGIFM